ncbi:unnamed protein product [Heligmosomoides polygyrus]|uniref:Uncharacterized protein n=1 Tax=Heligmosomoides polygyrus TaxID=6339 RepID=A0A183GLL6_HELPZ|nr:unnamed protein product [Heligmosomoides polygyrus]
METSSILYGIQKTYRRRYPTPQDSEDVLRTSSNVRRDSEDVVTTSSNIRQDSEDVLKTSSSEVVAVVCRGAEGVSSRHGNVVTREPELTREAHELLPKILSETSNVSAIRLRQSLEKSKTKVIQLVPTAFSGYNTRQKAATQYQV